MEKAQKHLKKGEKTLKKIGKMIEFVTLFDPTLDADDNPTAILERLEKVLSYTKDVASAFPAIGHVIGFYAEATIAFKGALDRLDDREDVPFAKTPKGRNWADRIVRLQELVKK